MTLQHAINNVHLKGRDLLEVIGERVDRSCAEGKFRSDAS
jgi:hypothetical protein